MNQILSRFSILLANPRGFCAGVDRAIDIVNRALDLFGAPIYVRHEVVHNKFVVETLKQRGAVFVDELRDVPNEKVNGRQPIVVFSAHGVSREVKMTASPPNCMRTWRSASVELTPINR